MDEIDAILSTYKKTKSIRGVHKKYNISEHRIRKILTYCGIIINENHRKILEFHKNGKSVSEISLLTKLSESTVRSYLPPKRPLYKINRSKNAIRIAEWRIRKKKEASKI